MSSTRLTRVASFDIGKKNFAFCVEEYDEVALKRLTFRDSYNPDGTPTEETAEFLNNVTANGRIVLHENTNITCDFKTGKSNCDAKKRLDPNSFYNMLDVLNAYKTIWDTCDVILIEEQMSFGKKNNKMAVKLAQHCYSYFVNNYRGADGKPRKRIVEFPSYHKTQVLGAQKTASAKPYKSGKTKYVPLGDKPRKVWSVERATEILLSRGEEEVLERMTSGTSNALTATGKKSRKKKKLDDLADVITQLQAYKALSVSGEILL